MSSTPAAILPPDQAEREQALDCARSVLVQAPAGSGKTDLLTRRFLRLLGEVDEPGQIVAITFTKAAAAEMRRRILMELEKAAGQENPVAERDGISLEALAARALARSRAREWNLIELPAQLRILTIDAFCRELALQEPLLSGLGGGLDIAEEPRELYRRAARKTLEQIDAEEPELNAALEELLLWRDNGWQEVEDLLVEMLAKRDRWMRDFVLESARDWEVLRARLERPFARAVRGQLEHLSTLLDQAPHARKEALELARFACEQTEGRLRKELAELAEFPAAPFADVEALEDARQSCACLAELLLTGGGFRAKVDKRHGFPAEAKAEKARLYALIQDLGQVAGLQEALAAVGDLPPARYTDEEWRIVRACFTLLRHAAGELRVAFAEAGAADYTEVAQIAERALRGQDGMPGDAALAVADGIRHLLVDEFQDTSRRQHELLRGLIAAWPEREGRSCFVVGDPMQSIYFFRDADAELFPRVRDSGLEIPGDEPLRFDAAQLESNFRAARGLVEELNDFFEQVFAADDGSGVSFARSQPARRGAEEAGPRLAMEEKPRMKLHLAFMPQAARRRSGIPGGSGERDEIAAQVDEMVALIRSHAERMEQARAEGKSYRVAVLGRARTALTPVAEALRAAAIPFRAVELEKLKDRQEVLDALALARALLNPHDRVAWLGVLRAPWCGLSLADLHALTSADDAELVKKPVRELLAARQEFLTEQGRAAARRVQTALESAAGVRAARPGAALGTWVEQVWLRLGGADCVNAQERANLDLLWRCLDGLRAGEQDVLGPALDAALEKLTALPDPEAGNECGVQLMTIHKAKGLEFEVVIVPELQARDGRSKFALLSWLERGLAEADETGEATEFLVAPLQPKGGERGKAKAWVEQERARREAQETRRILYVAATRAREELHWFARPTYKTASDGALMLAEPKNCLLAVAWPGLAEEARLRFAEWAEKRQAEPASVESIAAAGEERLLTMPPRSRPAILRRLPPEYEAGEIARLDSAEEAIAGLGAEPLYRRHEGGVLSRALGIAVHALLEELARLRATREWDAARPALGEMEPRIAAQVRGVGVEPGQAKTLARRAMEIALQAAADAAGQWILSPHAQAASEARWAGVAPDGVRAVQVDRVFRAGQLPLSEGDEAWWVIDYKTAHAEGLDAEKALPELRAVFAPQLEAYARVLRELHGEDATVCAGLYYPRMMKFDWWEI